MSGTPSRRRTASEAEADGPRGLAPALRLAVYGWFFRSGATALVFEILWSRQFVTVLGASSYAISVVLCAFMAGLGGGGLNGEEGYGFMVSATDGDMPGGGGTDRFRIKIWDSSESIVYDNQIGDADDVDATHDIGGGSIVIHER